MSVPDGVVLMYVKDGIVYPVALTDEQAKLLPYALNLLCGDDSLRVVESHPVGEAFYLQEASSNG